MRLMPWKPWALPALPSTASVVAPGDCDADVADERTVDAAELAVDDINEVALEARLDDLVADEVDDIVERCRRVVGLGRDLKRPALGWGALR